jgi:pilus assembly protein CpaB
MRPITILLISVALLIAGGLAFFSKRLVEGQVARAVKSAEEADSAQVLVAARTIGAGKVLDANDLRYDRWPKAVAAGQHVIARKGGNDPRKDHIGFVARRDLFEGEPVGPSAVFKPESGNKFSAMLAPGMRAITITITAESAIAGLAVPGDRVDVVLTSDVSRFGGSQPGGSGEFVRFAAETVLQNVKLLAIDQTLTRETGSKEKEAPKASSVGKTATVEVTPMDAERLILAGQMGKLSLILRSVGESADDRDREYTTDVETSAVLGKLLGRGKARARARSDDERPPPPTPAVQEGGGGPVIINRGGDRTVR